MEPTYVVVTGGAGFLGAKLCAQLVAAGKHHVLCLDNLSSGAESNLASLRGNPRFSFVKGDICEPFLVPGKLVQLYHLADPETATIAGLKARGEGTLRLLERAVRDSARVLVCPVGGLVSPESPIAAPHAEALALAFAQERGVDARSARVAELFGPGMGLGAGVVAELIETALKRRPIEVEGSTLYSLLFIDDAVRGLIQAMEQPGLKGKVLSLSMRKKVSRKELARLVARACGTRVRLAFELAAGEGKAQPVEPEPQVEQSAQLLQWEASTPLEDALGATAESLRPLVGPPEPRRKKRVEPQIPTMESVFRRLQ